MMRCGTRHVAYALLSEGPDSHSGCVDVEIPGDAARAELEAPRNLTSSWFARSPYSEPGGISSR